MTEQNKETTRRLYEGVSNGDVEAVTALFTDDMVDHEEVPGLENATGRERVVAVVGMFRTAFPDLTMAIDDMIAEGDKVFVRGHFGGTHEGDFMGVPATGKHVTVPLGDFFRFEDGKLAEHWGVTDTGVLMQQLGVTG